jgi:hypothetical protein
MTTNKKMDSYDETKKMLNTIRQIQSTVKPKYGVIQEQEDSRGPLTAPYGYGAGTKKPIPRSVNNPTSSQSVQDTQTENPQGGEENEDLAVINNVEIEIHSDDPEDLQLSDEEKGKISQLIDDFRAEVAETVDFGKMNIYSTSAKLDGRLSDIGLEFTFSTGDDTGLYIKGAMLKIDDISLAAINKLKAFEIKYSNTINDLLVNRRAS